MFRVPGVTDIQAAAGELGVELTTDEAAIYAEQLATQLEDFDGFVQSREGLPVPPRHPGPRDPGHRPGPAEDSHNAWTWKCRIDGTEEGPLAGKTVSYKDHIAVAGIPMSFGAYALEGHLPDFDATVVQRVLEAGGVITGKNVMNGLAGGFGFGGGVGDYGRPLNPHHQDHLSGGSSSGSAVALALGEVDISFGGDQGGSIRIPASWSGTVGLKPTFGLVSHFGIGFGSDQSIDYTGPMTRTVADCALALQATAGYDGLDPRQTKDVPDFYDATSRLDDGVEGLRIGILTEGFADATDAVKDSVQQAIDRLADLGAKITEISVPQHATIGLAQQAMSAEGALAVRGSGFYGAFTRTYYPESTIVAITRLWQDHQDLLDPRALLTLLAGSYVRQQHGGRVYARAQNSRRFFIDAYDAAFAEVDVLAMPTTPTQAPRYQPIPDRLEALRAALTGSVAFNAVANTRPFNFTGHPALAVPTAKRDGLPVSLQLVGPMFSDDLLLRAAQAYTQSVSFADHIALN